jgi:hypothetical protein
MGSTLKGLGILGMHISGACSPTMVMNLGGPPCLANHSAPALDSNA